MTVLELLTTVMESLIITAAQGAQGVFTLIARLQAFEATSGIMQVFALLFEPIAHTYCF